MPDPAPVSVTTSSAHVDSNEPVPPPLTNPAGYQRLLLALPARVAQLRLGGLGVS